MNRLKIAVIGVGALGRHHARILAGFDDVELVAVADTNPDTGRQIAKLHGTRWVDGYADIVAELAAVSIAVPTCMHRLVAGDFLSRRIPVLVEKPLAGNLSDADELVRLADENNTLLQVGHVERFNPATLAAWRLCGPPKYIRAERLSPYAFRSTDIGVVHDLMIHDLDLVLDLVGAPVRDVSALGFSILGEHEDVVQARITFENGCVADLSANRVNPEPRRSMDIWSGGGCVSVDFHERDVISFAPSEELLHGTPLPERARKPGADVEQLKRDVFGGFIKVTTTAVDDRDALTAELRSFVDCVRQQQTPLVDGHAALAAMEVADRILQSVEHHQWDGHAAGPIGPFAQVTDEQKWAG